jgi:hypothetical protein
MERNGRFKRIGYIVIFVMTVYLLLCSNVQALETTFEVAAGYDDNVAEVTDGEGSGIIQYRARFGQSLLKDIKGPGLDLYVDSEYSQYVDLENNYRLHAGVEFSTGPWHDRFRSSLFSEAVVYRDDLVMEDEHNTLFVGGNLQWIADARLTLSLQQTFSRVSYRNPVSLPGQRIYAVGKGKGKGPGGQEPIVEDEWVTFSQKDSVWSTEIMAICALGPDFETDLSILYRDSNSSNEYESYQEIGGYARMTWFYMEFLEAFVSGYWSKLDYDLAPESIERSDDVYGVSLGANWWVKGVKMFLQLDQTVNDSPVTGEDYKKSVALCGISHTF